MALGRKIGRFFGAWLTFAVLNGLGTAFLGGLLVTVFAILALLGELGSASNVPNSSSASSLLQLFPEFIWTVLGVCAGGFFVGCLTGLLLAPFGGKAVSWWSLIPTVGLLFFLPSYVLTSIPLLLLGLIGAVVSLNFVEQKKAWFNWDGAVREWLQTTWVMNPPKAVRLLGVFLPLLLGLSFDVAVTLAKVQENSTYITRIGLRETWRSSRASLRAGIPSMQRASCASNLKQIMLAVAQYTKDYDGRLPQPPTGTADGVAAVIRPYLKSPQLFQCPSDFYQYHGEEPSNGDFTDYWFNARLYSLSLDEIEEPAGTLMWGDGNTGVGEANSAYYIRSLPTAFAPSIRHLWGANYAFADGHVRALKATDISNGPRPSTSRATMLP